MNKENLLLIFTRNPELGKCKTRLASAVGDSVALKIYNFLLQHTVDFTKNVNAIREVHYSETIWENDIWDATIYNKKLQKGLHLGERMNNAFHEGFNSGYKNIIVIGSDMYDLTTKDINKAFNLLEKSDYIIGPAIDGGYYLLGMTTHTPKVFTNKKWGTQTVLKDTLNNLKNKNVALLKPKNDVDFYEDIKDIEAFKPFLKDLKI